MVEEQVTIAYSITVLAIVNKIVLEACATSEYNMIAKFLKKN